MNFNTCNRYSHFKLVYSGGKKWPTLFSIYIYKIFIRDNSDMRLSATFLASLSIIFTSVTYCHGQISKILLVLVHISEEFQEKGKS